MPPPSYCTNAPGSRGASHSHAGDWIVVNLTDNTAEFTDGAGKKRSLATKKDAVTLSGPETHAAANTGKNSVEVILVDLK